MRIQARLRGIAKAAKASAAHSVNAAGTKLSPRPLPKASSLDLKYYLMADVLTRLSS
jgi:hypothetical protein